MQLSEIKNDLATINYSPEINKLMLGDFILIEDNNQSILSQIISIEATVEEDVNSAMLKFLLSIDKEANLTQYSGYVPAKNASLILINPEEVVQLIKGNDKNVYFGNLAAYQDVPVELNIDFLRKRTYIQVDFVENKLQIVKSIIKGLEKNNRKTLLFDFQGLYERLSLPTVTIGYNFKLPLNYDALCYIAEEELNDFGNENKAIIQGILIEVQNYVKSTKDEFIPFDTLISVLDAQYDENPMSELLLLKNKLLKYQQQGLFAQEKSEFDFLDSFLKDEKNFKFDLSELPSQWHKIAFISILNIIKAKCYLITDFSNDNSNKTIIKKLYEKSEIKPIVISSYDYEYQLFLKAMSKNIILFKPIQKVNDFAGYTSFLNILSQDAFIVWGEQTLYIPLILKLGADNEQKIDKFAYQKDQNKNTKENNKIQEDTTVIEDKDTEYNINEAEESQTDIEETQLNYEYSLSQQESETEIESESDSLITEPESDDLPTSNDLEFFFDDNNTFEDTKDESIDNNVDLVEESQTEEMPQLEPNSDEVSTAEITNITDRDSIEDNLNSANDTISDLKDTVIDENLQNNETVISGTAVKENSTENIINKEEQIEEDKIEIQPPPIEVKSANVPVYTSNVAPQFDAKFAQGTYVHHPKYGRGIVEKVIKYGSKELCLIIFDSDGRKLLDPNIAELKQV